jgi:hypothetical protein
MPLTPESDEFFVPALIISKKKITSEVCLKRELRIQGTRGGKTWDAIEHQAFNPPSLAILRHAFFDAVDGTVIKWKKDASGKYLPERDDYVCPDYRLVAYQAGPAELTSDLLVDGDKLYHDYWKNNYHWRDKTWDFGSKKPIPVELSDDGFVLEYDPYTGLPLKTSSNLPKAESVFGDDASYFRADRKGVRIIVRRFVPEHLPLQLGKGPFSIEAVDEPFWPCYNIGARKSRQEDY